MRRKAELPTVRKFTTGGQHPRPGIITCLVCVAAWLASGLFTSPRAQEAFDASQLVGWVIEASVTNLQNGTRSGRKFHTPYKQDYTIELQANNALRITFSATAFTPVGEKKQRSETFVRELESPTTTAVTRGGGHGVWFFERNVLTFVRTYEGGAMKTTFSVTKTETGLRCNAAIVWPKEVGVPTIKFKSADGAKIEIVSAPQTASTCRIVKKN